MDDLSTVSSIALSVLFRGKAELDKYFDRDTDCRIIRFYELYADFLSPKNQGRESPFSVDDLVDLVESDPHCELTVAEKRLRLKLRRTFRELIPGAEDDPDQDDDIEA